MNRDTYSGCHLRRRAHSGLQSFHHPSGDTSSPDSHSLSLTSTSGLPSEHQSHMQKLSPITESNAKCWERMLALQKEYHCYHSARLDAAAEVVENGVPVECVPVPSRLCLDLLNQELRTQLDAEAQAMEHAPVRLY